MGNFVLPLSKRTHHCPRQARWIGKVAAFATGIALICSSQVYAEEMSFRNECFGNATEACFVVAEGKIDANATVRFSAFLNEGVDGYQVLLNSRGGNLSAGLMLGRAIRAAEMHTVIGRWNDDDPLSEPLNNAECLSACAYAFLGGVARTIRDGNKLGFHQVALPGGELLRGLGGLSSGQKISALLISYLVEMGVDARLFGLATSAASDEMFFPSGAQLEDYDIVTPRGFDHFFLEPYGDGILAASKRLDAPRAYDQVTDLTAFCREGNAFFLLTAPFHGLTGKSDFLRAGVWLSSPEIAPITISADRVRVWATDTAGYIQLSLTRPEQARLIQAGQLNVYFVAARVSGGSYEANIELNEMDKLMLAAAFRFCI